MSIYILYCVYIVSIYNCRKMTYVCRKIKMIYFIFMLTIFFNMLYCNYVNKQNKQINLEHKMKNKQCNLCRPNVYDCDYCECCDNVDCDWDCEHCDIDGCTCLD